jgi:hypothetical protein
MTAITIPNTFLPSTTISSTAMNQNFAEVADAIEASLALDGSDTMTGVLRLANGSATNPALTFGSDLNLGIYRKTVDELAFTTAGALAAHIDAAGKLWIVGDLDVGDDLDIGGDVTIDGTLTVTGATTHTGAIIASTIELGHASDTTLARSSAGNVSIEGNLVYRAGGTDVPVTDGGTGASTAAGARTNLGAVLTDAVFPGAIVCIAENNQSSGVAAAALVEDADTVRTLNTLVYNRNTMASLSSNRLTLPAGTWEIEWWAPIGGLVDAGLHQSFLYNQTDAAEVKRGIGGDMDEASSTSFTLASYGSTVVTIAAPKAFEIRHRCTSSGALQGDAASLGTEVYMRVIVRAA